VSTHSASSGKPLSGLFVLDLSRILAGPYCTMTLGDLGARVIKVEAPGKGDDTRGWDPPSWEGESAYYLAVNRNKESVTLDLKSEEGRAILWKLIERADIAVENFRPGTMASWGFSWEAISKRNPRLVYCSISGYGLSGPDAQRPGYDLIAQGEGGVMATTGEPDGQPMKAGVSQADIVAGLWALIGILSALEARHTTGRGQLVESSLLEGQLGLLAYHATNFWSGAEPRRLGNQHPNVTPYGAYAASDGHFTIGVGSERLWKAFCEVLGEPALADRPEFSSNAARVQNRRALDDRLAPILARHTVDKWLQRLQSAGIPCGKVRAIPEILADPHVVARGMIAELPHPRIPGFRTVNVPLHFSDSAAGAASAPPLLGQHTEAVLEEIGYDREAVARLRDAGIV
jgi:crotonobetainyl-CoA:carnitine CoA-transferase CaiB-like acyl-CoA transferase